MNYDLNQFVGQKEEKNATYKALRKLLALINDEHRTLAFAFAAILINSALLLLGPILIGRTIDQYIQHKQFDGVLRNAGILLVIYLIAFATGYTQTRLMGGVGQRTLFKLRNAVFNKLQELPVAFFNQNKAGDLISRVNNDTDKLNLFFSQALMQFISSIFMMTGAGLFLLFINLPLGAAALSPALLLWFFTQATSAWVKRKNALNLKSVGDMSAEIQESLNNFKVIIAFNRRDYFRRRFEKANQQNYKTAIGAGLANNVYLPIYGLSAQLGQLIVLSFGIYLIATDRFTVGLLISFLSYVTNFYNPLRQLATLWTSFQVALAGWDRISHLLALPTNLTTIEQPLATPDSALLSFRHVSFAYPTGREVLHDINFELETGKTYALVGPTGGGKTTTASLMARLYDPTSGIILLGGKDIRAYSPAERAQKIGFILQEPFLFTGTVRDNILYGNSQYQQYTNEQLTDVIHAANLQELLKRFDEGLDTTVQTSGDAISLGQKQLIAFMRAVLRNPDLLILDEATANIDTVTEKLLDEILQNLPAKTTLIIIAHRLNTIERADDIFFINAGQVTKAGSLNDAVTMLLHGKQVS
ncbi:ABC transporter ATP-binding protein/permease [Spirosoma sp. RP8]|uniref:ABC transporter ATP-binding protein/permease n=1 Tax=Spirosoma liriopis TaxID=2937440 RepID=A0ABT0HMW7_9BACT|nr:ABC transporter ATP-binding protein [Spirosoma liriopis]MCK8493509.1 ABC transporter ATP-binding protein/permease [Spirosoma liriopis]